MWLQRANDADTSIDDVLQTAVPRNLYKARNVPYNHQIDEMFSGLNTATAAL